MLQRLSVRGKILAVVAVPIIVLVLAALVVTLFSTQSLSSARNVEQLLGTVDNGRGFVNNLQTERNLSVNYVDAYTDGSRKRDIAQGTTDDAVAALDAALAENSTSEGDSALKKVDAALNRTQPEVFLVNLRALDATREELGDWLQFPDAAEVEAASEEYSAIATKIDEINRATPEDAGIKSELTSLSFAVGFEGTVTETYLTDPAELQAELIAALPKTDTSQEAFAASVKDIDGRSENDAVRTNLADFDEQVAQLANVRTQVVNRTISVAVLTGYYTATIEPLVKVTTDVASVVTDQTLASQLRAYRSIDNLVERVRSEEVYTDHLLRAGVFLPGDSTFQRSLVALSDIALLDAQDTVDPLAGVEDVPPFAASATPSEGDTSSFESIRNNVSSGLDAALVTERANDWPLQVSQELEMQIPIRAQVWEDAQKSSADALQATVLQTILTIVGAILVVIATIFVALVIARRIIGPLRRLTTTATAVRQELPRLVERVALPGEEVDLSEVQIPVESNDEIGRLAEAFNGVNAATLAIASEQAALRGSISEMFVNVARRDQVLLNRQLSSIDEMERTEDDPNTLTKLFALDHLATRMRRNSESLLVLAGIDTGRRLRRPMPLSDVIRTASSEIELYERVQLELDADPAMVGHSALTAAHLFAELLENATVFSDPGSPVIVRTLERDGDFIVEVEDSGIGMTLDELREANNRVASTAASEILGAQRLGLFVVGRIARRVGARVSITSKESAGTTATVTMPPSLFDLREFDPSAHLSSNAVDPSMQAPAALVSHNVSDEIIDNAPEPDATKRPSALGYRPAAVESGANLVGRPEDPPPAPAPKPLGGSVEDLIAADAAAAPEATPVDPAELSGGLTASGLPARRRRASSEPAVTSEDERAKIMGLPVRATPDQLSALDAESPTGFTPAVSPEEIAPQTAEERASMFRGFRSRKSSEDDLLEAPAPEAESLGQASRRGAFDGSPAESHEDLPVRESASPAAPETPAVPEVPVLEDDGFPTFAMPKYAQNDDGTNPPEAAAGVEPEMRAEAAARDPYSPPAAPEVAVSHEAAPEQPAASWSVPELEDDVPQHGTTEPVADAPMVIPQLEEDEEPVAEETHEWGAAPSAEAPVHDVAESPSEPAPQVEVQPDVQQQQPYAQQEPAPYTEPQQQPYAPQEPAPYAEPQQQPYGVEQVSLETGQTFSEPAPYTPVAQQAAPVPPAPVQQPPAPQPPAQQPPAQPVPAQPAPEQAPPAHQLNPTELAALTSTPSMDELMSGGEDDDKPNFFSRLFGRGKKSTEAPEQSAAPAASHPSPFSPSPVNTGHQGGNQAAPTAAPTPAPQAFDPSPSFAPSAEPAPEAAPAPANFAPHQPADDSPAPSHFSAAPAPAEPEPPAAQPFAPAPYVPGPVSLHQSPPVDDTPWHTRGASAQPVPAQPEAPAEPPASAGGAASFFAPRPQADAQPAHFTPDDLASPAGWEAAGASALQAAAPDVQTSYTPKVDLDPEHGAAPDLSSVFSEFSSLSSERPKVEKTRAGLQKRRAADAPPVEVKPIEEEVVVEPRERDADAIRSRFSSFYSGTQRARSDAAEFERSQATDET